MVLHRTRPRFRKNLYTHRDILADSGNNNKNKLRVDRHIPMMTTMRITATTTTNTYTHYGQKAKAEKHEGLANSKITSLQSYRHCTVREPRLVAIRYYQKFCK